MPWKNKDKWNNYRNRWHAKRRAKIVALKEGKPCTDCGIVYPHYVMEWDHLPGSDKKFGISSNMQRSMESILLEIAKCELVCANCHAIRTHERRMAAYPNQAEEADLESVQ